ncbi:uncharacterized protein LOC143919697 [Arctopsyche grandis]|uniref:uncharacterized protein LOC143919697 n=1 Tax=Arctopsyche grandis TaxID=121162 RepID=UPI00406D9712
MDTEDVSSTSDAKALETLSWPSDDLNTLLSNMKSCIPSNDNTNYARRQKKLPWNQIAFKNYSGAECEKVWQGILKKLRLHRLLIEVIADAEKWVAQPWTNFHASKKKNRHPDAPKRPIAPILLYLVDNKHLRKNFPDMKSFRAEINKMYANLPQAEKEKYANQFDLNREEYARKLKIFTLHYPELKSAWGKKSLTTQKKENSALQVYVKNQLNNVSKHDSLPTKELIEKFKNQWENLPTEEKLPWFEKSKKGQIKTQKPTKPKLGPRSVYALFSGKMLGAPELKSIVPKERMAKVSALYKELKPKQIQELQRELKEIVENYKAQTAATDEPDSKSAEKSSKKSRKKKKETADPDGNLNFGDISVISNTGSPSKEDSTVDKSHSFTVDKSHSFTVDKSHSFTEEDIIQTLHNSSNHKTEKDISTQEEIPSPKKKKKKDKNLSRNEIHPDLQSTNISKTDNSIENIDEENRSIRKKKKLKEVSIVEDEANDSKTIVKNESFVTSRKQKDKRKIEAFSQSDISNAHMDTTVEESEETASGKKKRKTKHISDDTNESFHLDTSSKLCRGEPELPPSDPFKLFSMEKRKKKSYSDEKLLKRWSNLDSSIQKSYKKSLKQLNKEYAVKYENFLLSLSDSKLRKYLKKRDMETS